MSNFGGTRTLRRAPALWPGPSVSPSPSSRPPCRRGRRRREQPGRVKRVNSALWLNSIGSAAGASSSSPRSPGRRHAASATWTTMPPIITTCVEIKMYLTARSNHCVVLHAIDATPARWRGDATEPPIISTQITTPAATLTAPATQTRAPLQHARARSRPAASPQPHGLVACLPQTPIITGESDAEDARRRACSASRRPTK